MRTNKIDPADLTEPLLTKQAVAVILGAIVRFVDKRVSDGSLRAIKVGAKLIWFRSRAARPRSPRDRRRGRGRPGAACAEAGQWQGWSSSGSSERLLAEVGVPVVCGSALRAPENMTDLSGSVWRFRQAESIPPDTRYRARRPGRLQESGQAGPTGPAKAGAHSRARDPYRLLRSCEPHG